MNDTLNLLKILLQIDGSDISNDAVLNFYITKAKKAIIKFCVISEDEYFNIDLINQTAELALYFYQNKKSLGLKDMTEGTRSKTYIEEAILQVLQELYHCRTLFYCKGAKACLMIL